MNIKLIALDLDGITLNSEGDFCENNRCAIMRAVNDGIHVVPITERGYRSIPANVLRTRGFKYVIASSGAEIRTVENDRIIRSNYIDPAAVKTIKNLLDKTKLSVEVCVKGMTFIERKHFHAIQNDKVNYRNKTVVLSTRMPVRGVLQLLDVHQTRIEKVSIYFRSPAEEELTLDQLKSVPGTSIIASSSHHIEIGAETCTKTAALNDLCSALGIDQTQMIAFGSMELSQPS